MFQKQKSKKQFSFDIKIPNNNSQKKIIRNDSNPREEKDMFIRKQDIYLIKLLQKRIKLTKMYKSKKLNHNMIKLINPWNNRNIKDEMKTSYQLVNKKCEPIMSYKNIKIKLDKKQSEENSFINYKNNKNTTMDNVDDLITSKIFNRDNSKNNKNILKIINQENQNNHNINFSNTKYNKHNSLIKLPKIIQRHNTNTIRNNRNLVNGEDSFYNFKTLVLKETKKNENYITIYEKSILEENVNKNKKYSLIDLAKKIQNSNYQRIFKGKSISPIKNINNMNII